MTEGLNKETLTRLYTKEKRSLRAIAKMYGLAYFTVRYRSIKYGIELRPQKRIDLNKSALKKLCIKEGKTTREIAKILGCSFDTVRTRCKEFGIPLRNPGTKMPDINELVLKRLYIKEDKSIAEIAKTFNCSVTTIYKRVKQFGLKKSG